MILAGIDIGNRTTEVALARREADATWHFLAEAIVPTTGIKGTLATARGARQALEIAAKRAGNALAEIGLVRINEAAPVVAGVAMQAITETILTDSTLIGHNPETPGGAGLGVGMTTRVEELTRATGPAIAVVPASVPFDEAASLIEGAIAAGIDVTAAIAEADDGVLIANRVSRRIPIVDEVRALSRVPMAQPAAVEVAELGATIRTLCNPYGLATIFELDAETTTRLAPAARALAGARSAVVIRTPRADVTARRIEAGTVTLVGEHGDRRVDLRAGAPAVMRGLTGIGRLQDALGDPGTAVGAMFAAMRDELSVASAQPVGRIQVRDLLATDFTARQPVAGGLSNEVAPERAVALAAMVEAGGSLSRELAHHLQAMLGIAVEPGGSEAEAGLLGALTTPGTARPLCVVDLGSGSTNAARIDTDGRISVAHHAGGGAMVDLLIGEELGIEDPTWREDLKRHRVARADGLFTLRHENGSVQFLAEPLPADLFGRTLLLRDGEPAAVPGNPAVDRVVAVRWRAKTAVFGANVVRALTALAPGGNPRFLGFVALIGGSALDFELPGLLADHLSEHGIVVGTANVRGGLGPRNAVATGLVLRCGPVTG